MSPLSGSSPNPLLIFARQSIVDQAKTTFSSWDHCMSKTYCKWPVIAAIIVGGLIVLSFLFCIARFCCCGVECCCMCCSCFNSCCPKPRSRKKAEYASAPQQPPPQSYGYQAPMNYGFGQPIAPQGFAQPQFARPQFATFDTSKRGPVNADALPAMPSWDTAATRKVEDTEANAHDDLEKNGGEGGIAMGELTPDGKRIKDDDDHTLYEDPDEQRQPMLQDQQHNQPPHGHGSYSDAGGYGESRYQESNPGDLNQRQPQHPYNSFDQQQNAWRDHNERSPASAYSTAYPPTYQSRAPTFNRDPYQQPPRRPSASPPLNGGYRGMDFHRNGPTSPPPAAPYGGAADLRRNSPASPPPAGSYGGPNYRRNGPTSPPPVDPYGGPNYSRNGPTSPPPADPYGGPNYHRNGPTSPPPANPYGGSNYFSNGPSPPPADSSYGGAGFQRSYSPSQSTQYEPTHYDTADRQQPAPQNQRSYGQNQTQYHELGSGQSYMDGKSGHGHGGY